MKQTALRAFERERRLLSVLVGDSAAEKVSRAPGGWRTLSTAELEALQLPKKTQQAIVALQSLSEREVPSPIGELGHPEAVARAYQARLGPLEYEVVVAVALDAQNRIIGEFEVCRGGQHGAAMSHSDIFHPLIRARASAFVLVHNHPSGDPEPSHEDQTMTGAVRVVGSLLGLPLLDHVIVAREGFVSFFERGLLPER